jgi:hypothetical protein
VVVTSPLMRSGYAEEVAKRSGIPWMQSGGLSAWAAAAGKPTALPAPLCSEARKLYGMKAAKMMFSTAVVSSGCRIVGRWP